MSLRPGPTRDWTAEHDARVRAIALNFFGAPVRIDIELLDRLPLPPGGKVLNVLSDLGDGADDKPGPGRCS